MSLNSELILTHSQACCVYFGEDITAENEVALQKRSKQVIGKQTSQEKEVTTEEQSVRFFYVMKPDDRGNIIYWLLKEATYGYNREAFLARNINNYQSRYEEYLKNLKMDNYGIIGYARKSPSKISEVRLTKIIGDMVLCLQQRSSLFDVYVSPCSYTKKPIVQRDMATKKDYKDNCGYAGDTQGKL